MQVNERNVKRTIAKGAAESVNYQHCRVLEEVVKAPVQCCGVTCWSASACGLAAGAPEAQLARLPNARASGISMREAVILRATTMPVH